MSTKGHRDGKDLAACVVLPVGRFVGGGLCLKEAGLVLPLGSGDFVVFPSSKITHFNLHYIGTRISVVCHSDGEGKRWSKAKGGWSDNVYFGGNEADLPMSE